MLHCSLRRIFFRCRSDFFFYRDGSVGVCPERLGVKQVLKVKLLNDRTWQLMVCHVWKHACVAKVLFSMRVSFSDSKRCLEASAISA